MKPKDLVALRFEENRGQTDDRVDYIGRGGGYTLFLTPTEAVMVASQTIHGGDTQTKYPLHDLAARPERRETAVLRMQLINANPRAIASAIDELPGGANFFIGSDATKWKTDVPSFARVEYEDVLPGIAMAYYSNGGVLEYDFIVNPGADPSQIQLDFKGAEKVQVDNRGDLIVELGNISYRQHKPVVYQQIGGERRMVDARFQVTEQHVSFCIGAYDMASTLTIDPVITFSTYLGGNKDDTAHDIAVDSAGFVYVAGDTASIDFPLWDGVQQHFAGLEDAFVTKLSHSGSEFVYSTYFGGSRGDRAYGVAADGDGNVYIAGSTTSPDFPTLNAFQPNKGRPGTDAFVASLSSTGDLRYSTFLGGDSGDSARDIAVDKYGAVYVTGQASTGFPIVNAWQPDHQGGGDVFITKLTADGSDVVYSTFVGGSGVDYGYAIAVDDRRNAYVTGGNFSGDFPTNGTHPPRRNGEIFVAKLSVDGSKMIYLTPFYNLGPGPAFGIAADAEGNAYITGQASCAYSFPLKNAFQSECMGSLEAFVAKLSPNASELIYSSYLGGSGSDTGFSIAIDNSGNAYVAGVTASIDFPMVNPVQRPRPGNNGFVTKINAQGSAIQFSTHLGGKSEDVVNGVAVDARGDIYVGGHTQSVDFPIVNAIQSSHGGGYRDGFVTKISLSGHTE